MTTDEPINTDVPTTTELTTTQPTAVEPTAVEPTATQLTATQPTAADLSGSWVLRTITEETTHQPFLGLELTFELTVSETSSGVVATGEKVAERLPGAGLRTYAPAARTSIALTGTFVEDDGLRIRFTEEGAVRPSSGEMLLRQVAESRFEGRFSSEAGGAAGRVVLERAQAASR
jgi:phosphomannomutase